MTQEQNHRSPLAPGEVRTHRVGNRVFRVQHSGGGQFTQASYTDVGGTTKVLRTDPWEQMAVNAYADAIERAETDAQADLTFNLPMGADMALVAGEEEDLPFPGPTPLEAIAVLRRWAARNDRNHTSLVSLDWLEREVRGTL